MHPSGMVFSLISDRMRDISLMMALWHRSRAHMDEVASLTLSCFLSPYTPGPFDL